MRTNTEIINNIDMTGNDMSIKVWFNQASDGRRQELTVKVSEESWNTLIDTEQNEYVREMIGVKVVGFGYQVQ